MRNGREQNGCQPKTNSRSLSAIDDLLIAGIKQGPAKKHEAINRILELVPHWTRADCWRRICQLRRASKLAVLESCHPNKAKKSGKTGTVRRPSGRPWTLEDDDKLFRLAGYEPVKKIARRLRRSVRAVRFRLGALGISAKVTDGWSLRELQKMLRVGRCPTEVSHRKLACSKCAIRAYRQARWQCYSTRVAFRWAPPPSKESRLPSQMGMTPTPGTGQRIFSAYPWPKCKSWICAGQLRVVDTFVTDRSFEEFCKNHGEELKASLIDSPTAKWLASEYGVSEVAANGRSVSRIRKHALVIRTCKCGRKIAGNPYFRHVRACQSWPRLLNLAAARGDQSNKLEPGSRSLISVQSSKST